MQTATQNPAAASARRRMYDSKAFEAQYHTDQPLGALWTPQATRFALWAPTARRVELSLYEDGCSGARQFRGQLGRPGAAVLILRQLNAAGGWGPQVDAGGRARPPGAQSRVCGVGGLECC